MVARPLLDSLQGRRASVRALAASQRGHAICVDTGGDVSDWRALAGVFKIGPMSTREYYTVRCPYVHTFVLNAGRGQLSSEWRHENDVTITMIIAGIWRHGDWQHVPTGCNALVHYTYILLSIKLYVWCTNHWLARYLADDISLISDNGHRLFQLESNGTHVVPCTHSTFGNKFWCCRSTNVNCLP